MLYKLEAIDSRLEAHLYTKNKGFQGRSSKFPVVFGDPSEWM